jgi:selenide, water dikinase
MESLDNAGVYKINDDVALIQTIDFFTPIVDDAYDFGQIAVANSLSDCYTMGGTPITALNIVCFPSKLLDISILKDVLKGGADKMKEAGIVLIGGHSIDDKEMKYGLSVTGTVNPKKLVTNGGSRPGDKLILTKQLGTGILSTAMKAGVAENSTVKSLTASMSALNKKASELMLKYKAHSCTDITGFGLIGHAYQMALNSKVAMKIFTESLPQFPEAKGFAEQGLCPGGTDRNREFYSKYVNYKIQPPQFILDLLFDPQTSGGLLISIDPIRADELLADLKKSGYKYSAIIGEIAARPAGKLILI